MDTRVRTIACCIVSVFAQVVAGCGPSSSGAGAQNGTADRDAAVAHDSSTALDSTATPSADSSTSAEDTAADSSKPTEDSTSPATDSSSLAEDSGADDSSAAAADSGSPDIDSASPFDDSGSVALDSGGPSLDSSSQTADSGSAVADSGSLLMDSSIPLADSGSAVEDSGHPGMDSSVPPADSGSMALDSGSPLADEVPGPSAALLANATYSLGIGKIYDCVTNYYVNGATGSDSNDGTTATTGGGHGPWATIQHADTLTRSGGDCINVAPGTYTWTMLYNGWTGFTITHGGSSASPTGYVAYRCQTLDACHVVYADPDPTTLNSPGELISVAAPYVVIDGFELDGGEAATYGGFASTCVNSSVQANAIGHHLWVLNNKVHGCSLGGIGLSNSEYYFAIHNEVYDNAWTSGYQGSGIGFVTVQALGSKQPIPTAYTSYVTYPYVPPYPAYTPTAQDNGFAPYHNLVLWNLVHDNGCTLCTGSSVASQLSLTATGNVTSGSTTISGLSSTAKLSVNELVVGPGIPPLTYVASMSGSSVTLTRAATGTKANQSFSFYTPVGGHTDGNGIIMDTWCALDPSGNCGTAGSPVTGNTVTYPSQTLIAFDDVENNGGRAIHVFASDNVTVANNSTYNNGLDITLSGLYGWTELSEIGGQNNNWYGNAALVGRSGNNAVVAGDGRGATSKNNIYEHNVVSGPVSLFNNDMTVPYWVTSNNKNTSPLYVAAGTGDPGNLNLSTSSPALGYAYAWALLPSGVTSAGAYP